MSLTQENIRLLGVNLQPLDRQRVDGVCERIHNLRPVGVPDQHRWEPVGLPTQLNTAEEAEGLARGNIRVTTDAAPDPANPASTDIRVITSSPATGSEASFRVLGNPIDTGTLTLTFTNLPTGNGSYSVTFSPISNPFTITNDLFNILTNVPALVEHLDISIELGENSPILRFKAKATGLTTNIYSLTHSFNEDLIAVTVLTNDFDNGTDQGETFRVKIGNQETADIVIDEGNNSVTGIRIAIRNAINGLSGWTASTLDAFTVRATSTKTTMQEDDNDLVVSATNTKLRLGELTPTAGGVNSRSDWGAITITMPQAGISVETAPIELEESIANIHQKIITALNNSSAFQENYQTLVPGQTPDFFRGIRVQATQTGPAFNTAINIQRPSGSFNVSISPVSGGIDVIAPGSVLGAVWYNRVNRGDMSIDTSASLNRMVILQAGRLCVVDKVDGQYVIAFQHTLESDPEREATFSQVDDMLIIGLSKADVPEQTLILIDDTFLPFQLPELPDFELSASTRRFWEDQQDYGLDPGFYSVRLAWRFNDGRHSALSPPRIIGLDDEELDGDGRKGLFEDGKRYVLDVTLKDYEAPGLYQKLEKIIDGIAVFVSPSTYVRRGADGEVTGPRASGVQRDPAISGSALEQFFSPESNSVSSSSLNGIFYDIDTIDDIKGSVRIDRRTEQIFTLPIADESNMVGHNTVSGAVAHSYNKRMLLGNTSVDFAEPGKFVSNRIETREEDPSRPEIELRWVVGIESGSKLYKRTSETFTTNKTKLYITDAIAYPDRRAQWIELWGKYDDEWHRLVATFDRGRRRGGDLETQSRIKLTSATRGNFSFFVGAFSRRFEYEDQIFEIPEDPPVYEEDQDDTFYDEVLLNEPDHVPGRIYASEVRNPWLLFASRTYFVNAGNNEAVQAFASNTEPVSQGQFGQYPLYVFTKNTIDAMEQSQDATIAFARMSPASTRIGVTGKHGVINVGRAIMFISKDGVYQLPSDFRSSVSMAIEPELRGKLEGAAIGYYKDGEDAEIWISSGALQETWCFNMTHGLWYSRDRAISRFFDDGVTLYSVDGNLYEEEAQAEEVEYHVSTGAMHFKARDYRKKLDKLKLKMTAGQPPLMTLHGDGAVLTPSNYAEYEFRSRWGGFEVYKLSLAGQMNPGEWIESFDISYETRTTHRRI